MLAAVLSPALALAHHGWSEYDSTKVLKLDGKVLESSYEHPHGVVRLAVPGKTWNVVLAPPSRMEFRGLSKDLIEVGKTVSVEGYANRGKPEEMRAERITAGGKTVELR
jgi:hypothetical protein